MCTSTCQPEHPVNNHQPSYAIKCTYQAHQFITSPSNVGNMLGTATLFTEKS